MELEARVDSRQIKLDPRNASPGEPAPDTADVPKTVKELSAEITAAIRKDMVTLSVQLAAKSPEFALPGEEASESTESGKSGANGEKTTNSQDAVEYSWSQYLELLTGNLQMEAVQNARMVQIDWSILLNWTPNPGKTLEENMQDLAFQYQTLWRVIVQNFSGGQQMELLARLDMLMMSKLEQLFQMDLMKLYDFLVVNGQRDAAESIRTSVQRAGFAMAHGQSAQNGGAAQSVTAQNGSSGHSIGSEGAVPAADKALGRGTAQGPEYAGRETPGRGMPPAADSARFAKTPVQQGNLFYSPGELRQASRFVENLAPPKYGIPAESDLGKVLAQVDVGLLSLKTQVFLERADISPQFAETMRQAMDQFLTTHQETARQGTGLGEFQGQGRRQPNVPLRRGTVQYRSPASLVAERMSETYARTGNAREAVLAGVRYARELTVGKDQPYRDSEQLFWKAILFGAGEMAAGGRKAPMQQIRENWNHFVNGMDLRRGKSAELYIGAYESGGLQMSRGQGGNLPGAVTNAAVMAFLLIPPVAALLAGKSAIALGLMAIDLVVAFVLHKALNR